MKKKRVSGRVRLNIRMPAHLVDWAKDYARAHDTSVTQLLTDYIFEIKKKAEAGDVPQF